MQFDGTIKIHRKFRFGLHQLRNRFSGAAPLVEEGAEADWRPPPQFQSGWRIPLKAPIELSNINVFKRFRNYCGLYQLRNRCSPEADHRESSADNEARSAN
jgi:hypothetical protein